MSELRFRPMTATEFEAFRRRANTAYAGELATGGNRTPDEARRHAERETDALLPDGVLTPGHVFLVAETAGADAETARADAETARADAETAGAGVIGMVWVALVRRQGPGAWIYYIEVEPEQRGRGYGRALLGAAERLVKDRGGDSIGLSVFGGNVAALRLYESSGYEATSIEMRKSLSSPPRRVCTIGVYEWDLRGYVGALSAADVRLLLDVRQRRGVRGREYAWANSVRLQQALADAEIEYEHRPELAPTTELRQLQYAEDARSGVGKRSRVELAPEYRDRYTHEILDRVDLSAIVARLPLEGAAALFCVEADPEACHRSIIAARLARDHDVLVTHLRPAR